MSGRLVACQRGQASVELVALLPLVAVVALAAAHLLAVLAAYEQAGGAAEAGAIALLRGEDPRAAARDALPGLAPRRVRIDVRARKVRVHVAPRLAMFGLRKQLTATAIADAGRAAPGSEPPAHVEDDGGAR